MASISGGDAEKNVIVFRVRIGDWLLFSSLEKVACPLSVQNHIVIRSSDRVHSPQLREKVRMRGNNSFTLTSCPLPSRERMNSMKASTEW
jgi:hypothetical protein